MGIISHFEETRDGIIYKFAKKYLSNKKILEIGCGGSDRTKLFYNVSDKVTGIDIINRVKKEHKKKFNFVLADALNLPFKNSSFDAVVSFDVIEHVNDVAMLSEVFRVCKKNGWLFLGTPNQTRLSSYLFALAGQKITFPYEINPGSIHLREYTIKELVNLVEKCQFKVIKEMNIFLGLLGKIDLGFNKFPKMLSPYVQYLFLIARK